MDLAIIRKLLSLKKLNLSQKNDNYNVAMSKSTSKSKYQYNCSVK